MTRFPDWDLDRARGEEAERYVAELRLLGERVEVKRDDRALTTGNIFIEHACKSATGDWFPSGIETTKADAWAFVFGKVVLLAPTPGVRAAWQWGVDHRCLVECAVGSHPTKGVAIGIARFIGLAHAHRLEGGEAA